MVRALEEGIGATADEQRIKIPPNSIEAEQSLIGGLMLDAQAWDKIADVVVAEDFYRRDHQLVFAAIANLVEAGSPCDVVTVSEYLDKRGELEAAGSLEYLATLANETPGAANARAYARILRDRAVERALIHVGNQISGNAFATDGRSATELVDEAERLVFEIGDSGTRGPRASRIQVAKADLAGCGGPHRRAPPVRRGYHRYFHRLHGIRQTDSGPPVRRSRDHRRTSFDGQDDACREYC
jgi:replicative DNA helicase